MNANEAREVLGLDSDADEKTIRRAYAKLAKTYRPDTHPEEFSRIRAAYDALLDAIKHDDYEDPDLPTAPDLNTTDNQTPLPARRAVSYVMDEQAYGGSSSGNGDVDPQPEHDDVDAELEAVHQQSYRTEVEANPLQSIEDSLIEAIKEVKPGQLDSENKVVLLVDEYLQASNTQSRKLRDYVERFLIGTCLGDYYLPHAVRERVADFSGLSNVIASQDRLQPWEREFLARFDESEQVEELLIRATSRSNVVERALIHGGGWGKAFMLRLDETKAALVNRWMYWSDQAYGEEGGLIDAGFRAKWAKLEQVEPLNPSLIAIFIALMVGSGLALNALGVPLREFFQLPVGSMLKIAAGLTVLSWANFILVQMARPVIRVYVARVRDWLFTHLALPLLVVEVSSMFLLIWGWALDGVLPSTVSRILVVGSGCVLIVVGVFAREWSWVNHLSFPSIVIRLLLYFYVAVNLLDDVIRTGAASSSLWLIVGLVVWVAPPKILFEWVEKTKNTPQGYLSLRHANITLQTRYPRWCMAGVAIVCILLALLLTLVQAPSYFSPIIFGVLVTALAVELAMIGGVHVDSHISTHRYFAVWGLFFLTSIGHRFVGPSNVDLLAQSALGLFLIWSAVHWLSPKTRARIKGW